MSLNNRGFAITGILYTLFIMFLLILVSVLGALSSRKNMLERSVKVLEDGYIGIELNDKIADFNNDSEHEFPVTGKYIFSLNANEELSGIECITYAKAGAKLADIHFTNVDCNEYKNINLSLFTLTKIISFEKEG